MSSAISQFLSASELAQEQSSRGSVLWRLPNDQLVYLLTDGLFDLKSICRLDTSVTNKELRSHFLALIRYFLSCRTPQMCIFSLLFNVFGYATIFSGIGVFTFVYELYGCLAFAWFLRQIV